MSIALGASRAAAKIKANKFGRAMRDFMQNAVNVQKAFRNITELTTEGVLKDAARGFYAPVDSPPLESIDEPSWCGWQRPCDRACLRRAAGLNRALQLDDHVFDVNVCA